MHNEKEELPEAVDGTSWPVGITSVKLGQI